MATHRAIAATSEALRTLLEDACPRAEFPDARFELWQASDFQRRLDEGITVFLSRVAVNMSRRNLPSPVDANGRRFRPPLPVDLYYLVGAWGRTAARQHGLLGWCMRALEDAAILPAGVLNGPGAQDDTFRTHEAIELVCEALSLSDLNTLWEMQKPNVPLAVSYVARGVLLDSTIGITTGAPVQARVFEFAK